MKKKDDFERQLELEGYLVNPEFTKAFEKETGKFRSVIKKREGHFVNKDRYEGKEET
jgi:hypothetical protein